jgi:ABC-type lipoprotein export system ATPase subunit
VALKNVSFSYDGRTPLFSGLTLTFPSQGLVVILGRSGSGKTTLLSLMEGQLKPTSGTIDFPSGPLPAPVFQSALLLDYLSLEDNVLLGRWLRGEKEDRARAKAVLKEVGLTDVQTPTGKLSGGEKMRVAIARALLLDSSVLILDEPTGQLDEENALGIYQLLKDLGRKKLVILVTHDEVNARRFGDELYQLKDQKLVLIQTPLEPVQTAVSSSKERVTDRVSLSKSLLIHRNYLKKHPFRLFLATFLLALALTIGACGLSFVQQLDTSLNTLVEQYYASDVATLSHKETISQSGKLTLERYSLPSAKELSQLGIKTACPCLDYFLPAYNDITLKDQVASIRFLPVLKEEPSKLATGQGLDKAGSLVVNLSFLKEFSLSESQALGQRLSFSHASYLAPQSLTSKDVVPIRWDFTITGIAKEKTALNEAIGYYSYDDAYEVLKGISPSNISQEIGQAISLTYLLEDKEFQADDFTSHKKVFSYPDMAALQTKSQALFGEAMALESKTLEVKDSTEEIVSSLTKVVLVFLFLALVSAFLLEFLSLYSLFSDNLRLFALAKAFTRQPKNQLRLAFSLGLLFFGRTVLFLVLLTLAACGIINGCAQAFAYPALVESFPLGPLLLVIFLAFLISLPASFLAIRQIQNPRINRELEGED